MLRRIVVPRTHVRQLRIARLHPSDPPFCLVLVVFRGCQWWAKQQISRGYPAGRGGVRLRCAESSPLREVEMYVLYNYRVLPHSTGKTVLSSKSFFGLVVLVGGEPYFEAVCYSHEWAAIRRKLSRLAELQCLEVLFSPATRFRFGVSPSLGSQEARGLWSALRLRMGTPAI